VPLGVRAVRRFRSRSIVGVAVAGSLLIMSCGGDDDDDAGSTDTTAGAETATSAEGPTTPPGSEQPAPTTAGSAGTAPATTEGDGPSTTADPLAGDGALSSAAETDPAGVLRFGYTLSPSQGLDPHKTSLSQDTVWLAPIYDPLIIEMPDATLVPGLATAWEWVDDNAALELTLREGVTFQDGTPFDAAAVKINIERAKTVEGSAVAPLLGVVDTVEVVDPMTVRMNVSGPAATLPRILADRPGMMISPAAIDDPDLPNHPVGAGMYQVQEYRAGDRAIMVPFPDYWNPDWVKLGQLEIVAQSEALTRLNGLRSGELDLALLDPSTFEQAERSDLATEQFSTTSSTYLHINRTRAHFDDIRVRQALNHAIDRDAILTAVYLGYGHASSQYYSPEFEPGYVEGLDDRFPYDPDKARQLLAEAGLADGFSFDLLVPSLVTSQGIAQIVQAQLAEVGITVNFIGIEASLTASTFFNDKVGDIVVGGSPGRTDPANLVQLFFTAAANSNPGGHTVPEVDALYNEALVSRSVEERAPILLDLMRAVTESAGEVWLLQPSTLLAGSDQVAGFHWSLRGQPDFRGTGMRAG
jgi:peptide/nickel transport system substrate-binding protein